ncbi:hypothetical protein PVL29_024532 [Vitis rotundifolia]|uniref:ADP-ribosyl cyclase/cyclic ADP-ribose hydrolase n=1 Tax=Vitis rotundifolia TaxID=103349 RepID=A0AA39DAZ6_VITRO|nr:hypothetical protein PVL29_024532 [Vitis rotundifolia]
MASSSSSSASNQGYSFDVFLSFRGEDTRNNFTDHLFVNLDERQIKTFKDNQLERGEEIKSELLKTIEESRISIVVFSKNYANSKWCLDELAKIMECREEKKQTVLPVFYHVDPSDVRKQTGSFGEAFSIHERNVDATKVQRWRDSLTDASNLSGFHVNDGPESVVIKEIIDDINTKLNLKSLYVDEKIVGMNIRLEKLISLINIDSIDVCMVGICGLGGIGKTTIAKALYDKISNQFQGASFLANVRENSKKDSDLLQLQRQLLDDIEKGKNRKISNVHEGMNAIKNALSSRRVLVVLDDVDNFKQLQCLVGKHGWFGEGSRILITTRDRQPLVAHEVDKYYEIEELNSEEALQLFSLYAFKPKFPQEDYKDLLDRIVKHAKGLPLALQVLGSHLCTKTPSEWESELRKLEREPVPEIQNVLKISYDGLDRTQGEIFLDIACFFKGQDKDFVSRILDGCDFYAKSGFRVLHDRCFITILDNKIHMHDLIQEMGWHIVREKHPKEPGKWSRLWEHNDVHHVLTRNTGTKAIEGIFLDMSTSKQMQFTTKAFKMMTKLRLLKVHQDAKFDPTVYPWRPMVPSEVLLSQKHFCRDFEFPSKELRYLHWDGYPLKSLPSTFYAKNLVELNLRCSSIKQLWKTERHKNLKVINLSSSEHLKKIPNPSSVPNLEILTLEGCINLESLPRRIYKLRHLKTLCCTRCVNLRSFPEIMGDMTNLRELYLEETAIVKLPSSIEHLKKLEHLKLPRCEDLITVPQSICNLTSLKLLDFSLCSKLEKLPEDLKSLKCLETLSLQALKCQLPSLSGLRSLRELYIGSSNLTQGVIQSNNLLNSLQTLDLSDSNVIDKGILIRICHLSSLERLYLHYCNLKDGDIPSELWQLSSLKILNLSWNDFSSIPASISQLSKLKALGLSHCRNLQQIPELPSTLQLLDAHDSHFTLSGPSSFLPSSFSEFQDFVYGGSARILHLHDSVSYFEEGVSIFIPGMSGIPELIMDQNMGNHVTIDLPQDWYEDKDFLGFALCLAFVPLHDESEDDFEHGFEDKSEIQSENESDHDEGAHKSEDESENGSAYNSDNKSEDASEERFPDFLHPLGLHCQLTFHGDQHAFLEYVGLKSSCVCHENDDASGKVWVLYYSKFAMQQEKYHSNKWRRLKASFGGYYDGMPVKVEKCGMQLIYAENDNCPTPTQHNDSDRPPIHYVYSRKRKGSVLSAGS